MLHANAPRLTTTTIALAALPLAAAVGYRGDLKPVLALAVLMAVAWATLRYGLAAPVVALIAIAVNGLPTDLAGHYVAGKIAYSDIGTLGLIAIFGTLAARRTVRVEKAIVWLCAALALWWLVTWARTIDMNISATRAASESRDFLFFALLLPVVIPAMRDRDLRTNTLIGTGALALLLAIAETAASLGHPVLSAFVHTTHTVDATGITRLYTQASELVAAAFGFALGGAFLLRERRLRIASLVIAAACFMEIVLSLGRAKYLGVSAGLLLATALWITTPGVARRATKLAAVSIASFGLLVFLAPHGQIARNLTAVGDRVGSTVSDVSNAGSASQAANTLAVRDGVRRALKQRLGGQWPIGLGFIPPDVRYDPNLPHGDIRDSDVGNLNAIMTMGWIGLLLIYTPVIAGAVLITRARWRGYRAGDEWLLYGSLVFLVLAVGASQNLVDLFSTTGLTVTALTIALGLSARSFPSQA